MRMALRTGARVIAVTGDRASISENIRVKLSGIAEKPLDTDELREMIRQVLKSVEACPNP